MQLSAAKLGRRVSHASFGPGTITRLDGNYACVWFDQRESIISVAVSSLQPHNSPGPTQFRRRGPRMERIRPKEAWAVPAKLLVRSSPFDEWWDRLRKEIKPGFKVYHWSAFSHNQLDGNFTVSSITATELTIENPDWRIPREDFAAIFPQWRDYSRGLMPRQKLDELTWSTTYIFSIMHVLAPQPDER